MEARYRDALLDGLVPPADPPPPPPSPVRLDLANWFQALATYPPSRAPAAWRAISSSSSGSRPATVAAAVKSQGERFLAQHAPEFLGEVMNLGLTFVSRLQQSSSLLSDGLYDRVLGQEQPSLAARAADLPRSARARPETPRPRPSSSRTRAQAAADVVCRVSAFTRRTGGDRFSPALEIAPERFKLAPGEQQDVNIRLLLDPRRFAIATDHVATLLISGAGHRDLVVQLIARAESPVPVAKARDAAPERRTRAAATTRSRASHASRKR